MKTEQRKQIIAEAFGFRKPATRDGFTVGKKVQCLIHGLTGVVTRFVKSPFGGYSVAVDFDNGLKHAYRPEYLRNVDSNTVVTKMNKTVPVIAMFMDGNVYAIIDVAGYAYVPRASTTITNGIRGAALNLTQVLGSVSARDLAKQANGDMEKLAKTLSSKTGYECVAIDVPAGVNNIGRYVKMNR